MNKKIVSTIMLTLLLLGMLSLTFNIHQVKAGGTIYIGSDYTFTSNIYEPIVVTADNIIIDGNGYTLQGTGSGIGINLTERSYVTIKKLNITAFYYGIWLLDSSSNSISGNNITNNEHGIILYGSPNNTFRDNDVRNNKYNLAVYGSLLSHFIQDIDDSNTVDGKPVYYWVNRRDMTVLLDAGYVALVNCTNITVKNLNLSNNGQSVLLAFTTNSTITKNNITNSWDGIYLTRSPNSTVFENNITNNDYGIYLTASSNSTVFGNNITNNEYGISLVASIRNTISGNNITNNEYGIYLTLSFSNEFHHNNFISNTQQVYDFSWHYPIIPPSINTWDDGYPSGGNYWSDHVTVDDYCGVNQDEPGSDGIVDESYVIDDDNRDNYPLVNPWGWDIIPPVADAGPDQTVYEDTLVTFDGNGSYDNVGIVSYVWTFIDVTPQTLTGVNPTYTFTTPGIYTVTLDVSDVARNHATDTVTITVLTLSPEELIQGLIETIETSDLPKGTKNSLTSKLKGSLHLLDIGNKKGAIHKLMVFIHQVESLLEKKLSNEQADYMISKAQKIIDRIKD